MIDLVRRLVDGVIDLVRRLVDDHNLFFQFFTQGKGNDHYIYNEVQGFQALKGNLTKYLLEQAVHSLLL